MKVKTLKLNSLVMDDRNSVTHDEANKMAIRNSLEKFGQYRAFVVQKSTKKVIVGNCMLEVMLENGETEGYAYVMDIGDKEAALLGAADNKTGTLSEWDYDALKDILSEQDSTEALLMGWENCELNSLMGVSSNEPIIGDDEPTDDFDFDSDKEKAKKNTGTLKFDEESWSHVRDAIVEIREEFPESTESEAIAITCKRYVDCSREDQGE